MSYLKQLSYAFWVQDLGWVWGIKPGFETFQAWAMDPHCDIDLEVIKVNDIVPLEVAMEEISTLGQEYMADAEGISRLGHNPFAVSEDSTQSKEDATPEEGEALGLKESSNGVGPAEGEKVVMPEGEKVVTLEG